MSYPPRVKNGKRMMHAPNPYASLSTFKLAGAAGELSDELRTIKPRTPQERRELADRCIYMLIACNQRLYGHKPVAEPVGPGAAKV